MRRKILHRRMIFPFLICMMLCVMLGGCGKKEFTIVGKWKSVGDSGFGQAQPGSIIVFNDSECNFFSPADKYAFYEEDGEYVLEVMGLLSTEALTFTVEVEDEENIEISGQSTVTKLKRVE